MLLWKIIKYTALGVITLASVCIVVDTGKQIKRNHQIKQAKKHQEAVDAEVN